MSAFKHGVRWSGVDESFFDPTMPRAARIEVRHYLRTNADGGSTRASEHDIKGFFRDLSKLLNANALIFISLIFLIGVLVIKMIMRDLSSRGESENISRAAST